MNDFAELICFQASILATQVFLLWVSVYIAHALKKFPYISVEELFGIYRSNDAQDDKSLIIGDTLEVFKEKPLKTNLSKISRTSADQAEDYLELPVKNFIVLIN